MKTTVDVPEELLHRVKIAAAQRKTTLREMVILGLDMAIASEARSPEEKRQQQGQKLLQALQAKNTEPMQPFTRSELYSQ
jgi:hypothetical protein